MTKVTAMRNQPFRTIALALTGALLCLVTLPGCNQMVSLEDAGPGKDGGVFFCFWNAENFFDDVDNNRKGPGDKEYDPWFANHPDILKLKLEKMTDALLKMNDGHGPDIIALVEVESVRAAELLKDALNARAGKKYTHVLMKEVTAGRHIAPCVITRLPVVADRTELLGKRERILKTVVKVNDHELVVIVAHFTSRLGGGGEGRREEYGDKIYGAFRAMYANNKKVDVLVCGDFNDTPEDESIVKHLHATGDRQAVLNPGNQPKLYNLLADKDASHFGTHFYNGKWLIFDQIMVSPGMLDREGWSCDVDSVRPFNALARPGDGKGRPWRFGGPNDKGPRGYSDHFPMTLRLHVQGR
jgi:endonuclease/exonuclease/phosphatase family metal-dependent hydrolase